MWQVISIFLQAAGVLLLLWTLVGWLVLGRDRGGMAVFTCLPGQLGSVEPFLRCCMWLRGTGMLRMPVLLELPERLKMEAEKFGGFGTAAGDCGGGGVPKC